MDSLSQLALGASVGHVVLGRRIGRRALVLGAIFGTIPDLDVLLPMGGPIESFTSHRGASHSWIVHAAVSPLLGFLLAKLQRKLEIGWAAWAFFLFAVFSTHAALDAFTVYGTQLFWPFASPPVAIGSIFIIDPLYTLPLLVGGAIAWRRAGAGGMRANAIGLALSCAYLAWSFGAQQAVLREARSSLASRGVAVTHLLATPSPFNTLLWRIVAIDGDRYHEGLYSLVDGAGVDWVEYARGTELTASLSDDRRLRRLDWFTHGFWAVQREGDDVVVEDLRMGAAPDYVFRFRIARVAGDGTITIAPVESRGRLLDPSRLNGVWKRIWDPRARP